MNLTKIFHKNTHEASPDEIKARVCDLLDWDEMQYATYQMQAGQEYLRHYIPADPDGQDMLIHSRTFWNWWKNHWTARDRAFLGGNVADISLRTRLQLYADLHDAASLAGAIYPNGVVLEMSYSEMIQSLFDNEIHAR